MAAVFALLVLLGAMFGGAMLVDGWRSRRLRAWADAEGLSRVEARIDGGALLTHAQHFSKRVRSFGLTFHQVTPDDEVWLAEHRANLPTGPSEKWHTLVVVRVPGAEFPTRAAGRLDGWGPGGEVAAEGDLVRWRRPGLLWPSNAAETLAHGRALAARLRG